MRSLASSCGTSPSRSKVGAEGTLLGWTDHLRATFERDGLVPHELASERTLHLAIPGQTEIVDRIDRSTRRFTPGGSR